MPTKEEQRKFSELIQEIVEHKKMSYMEAVVHHCELTGFEVEMAASLLTAPIKAKIGDEAQDLNMMKKVNKLPI
jgi:predicted CopG family antitoxin